MLPSIETALNEFGKQQKAIASEVGVTTNTLHRWFTGRTCCPIKKRKTLDRAIGCDIDWVQYALEFEALNRSGPVGNHPKPAPVSLAAPLDPEKRPVQDAKPKPPTLAHPVPLPEPREPAILSEEEEFNLLYGIS